MPRIPEIQRNSPAPSMGVTPQANATTFGGGVSQGLARLGEGLGTMAGYLKDYYDRSNAEQTLVDSQRKANDLVMRLKNGGQDEEGNPVPPPAPDQIEKVYSDGMTAIHKEASDKLGENSRSWGMFTGEFTPYSEKLSLQVKQSVVDQYQSRIRANNDVSLRDGANLFVDADEINKPQIRDNAFKKIEEGIHAGIYTEEQGQRLKQNFIDDTSVGSLRKMMKADPEGAIIALDSGEFRELSVEKAAQWRNTLVMESERQTKQRMADLEHAERRQEKEQKKLSDATYKTLTKAYYDGNLTMNSVNAAIDDLEPEKYKLLAGLASGREDVKSDPTTYAGLRAAAGIGVDVRSSADAALFAKTISINDYDKIMSEVEANSAGPSADNWYKRGSKYLAETTGANDPTANPFRKQLAAKLMDDWVSWAKAHPEATVADAQREWTSLGEEGKLVQANQMTLTHRTPRYLPAGKTAATATAEDIATARKKTTQLFDSKKIDEYEATRQAILLDELEAIAPKTESVKVK